VTATAGAARAERGLERSPGVGQSRKTGAAASSVTARSAVTRRDWEMRERARPARARSTLKPGAGPWDETTLSLPDTVTRTHHTKRRNKRYAVGGKVERGELETAGRVES